MPCCCLGAVVGEQFAKFIFQTCVCNHRYAASTLQTKWIKLGEDKTISTLFPTVYFIGKYILVLDRDTFRLELDYKSIMHILVKVTSN